MNNLVNELKEKMLCKTYDVLGNIAGNILLRQDDNIKIMGENRYNAFKEAFEQILEENYLNDNLYKYYKTYDENKYGFCTYKRWLAIYNK